MFHIILLSTIGIDYDGLRPRLRTAATNGPVVHHPGDMWAWAATVMMIPAGDNSWLSTNALWHSC
jgi:hypothetical protein